MEKLLISERLLFRSDKLDMTTKLKRVDPVLRTRLFSGNWLNIIN